MPFRVDLEIFRGPLDLLLYLVRKHEVEITELPIAPITEQFLAYLEVLKELDINAVGDFLDVASTLIEIKSRMVLPRAGEVEEEVDDARHHLVSKLLEYKKFKDAASMLEDRSRAWQERFARMAPEEPAKPRDPKDQPLLEVELWDLVSALGRMLRSREKPAASSIVYDETPIHVYMTRIQERLNAEGRVAFSQLFAASLHKSQIVGMFLAVLELVRHYRVRAEQDELFGELFVLPGEKADLPLDEKEAGADYV